MGNLLVSWTQPSTFADGSLFTNGEGFKVLVGTFPGSYTMVNTFTGGGLRSAIVSNLYPGVRHYIVVQGYDNLGNVSLNSDEISAIARIDRGTHTVSLLA